MSKPTWAWHGPWLLTPKTSLRRPENVMATQVKPEQGKASRTYSITGTLLEACSCRTLCRCWIGEDPDDGACDAFNAYHIDKGEINGVDVTGLNYVQVVKIPGNVLVPKTWKRVTYLDAAATPAQRKAILDAWHGKLGGPLADLNGLIGEDIAVHDAAFE